MKPGKLKDAQNKVTAFMISAAMVRYGYKTKLAADDLGITPEGLNYQIRRLRLTPESMAASAALMGLPKPSSGVKSDEGRNPATNTA